MSGKRPAAPSHRSILSSWFNRSDAEELLGIDCFDNIAECTNGHWNCWACGIPRKEKSLEKCHIVPYSLDGSNDPLNYFLMCSDCHNNSPDTRHIKIFISWVSKKISYQDELINQIYEVLGSYPVTEEDAPHLSEVFWKEMQGVGLHGGRVIRSSALGLLEHVCDELYNKQP